MSDTPQPEIVLGIPGAWPDRTTLVQDIALHSDGYLFAGGVLMHVASGEGVELRVMEEHNPRVTEAFRMAGARKITAEEQDAIAAHTFMLYLIAPGGSFAAAWNAMRAAAGLLKAGGLAVKVETAGVAHNASGWLALTAHAYDNALYYAFTTLVGADDGRTFYSAGMHNLGLSDVQISGVTAEEAAEVLQGLLLYMIMEQPQFSDGHSFSLRPDSTFFRLEHGPCTLYETDDPFYNPYGMWQLNRTPFAGVH